MTESPPRVFGIAKWILQSGVFKNVTPLPCNLEFWDGSRFEMDPSVQPRLRLMVRHPRALRRLLFRPDPLMLGESYIFGDVEIEGSIEEAFPLADALINQSSGLLKPCRIGWKLVRAGIYSAASRTQRSSIKLMPKQASSLDPLNGDNGFTASRGRLTCASRVRRAINYHYDQSLEFWRYWLDEQLVYSCAYFQSTDKTLEEAQSAKLDLVCRKLRLRPGENLLDLGCGWGALIVHAARKYGVNALGITLSPRQAQCATERAHSAGVAERCKVEVRDFRKITGEERFEKVASIGAIEHVPGTELRKYFRNAYRLLRPGGAFLNHGVTISPTRPQRAGASFLDRYVFPDYELASINTTLKHAESSGFEVRDVENLREHYALTLRHWCQRLVAHRAEIEKSYGAVRYRIYHLYLAGAAYEFEKARLNLYQALLIKPCHGESRTPLTREDWYSSSRI